jgi:hypothetical protein
MIISQDTYNKIVTTLYMVFCMAMFAWSYGTGRPLDLTNLSVLIAPILPHAIHILTQTGIVQAQIKKNGVVNGGTTHS